MATYLQGVTDYIPEYQPFQPDYNFYSNLLQAKQNQYDTNYKAINHLYGQLYNSELTHDENIKKKQELLKQIDFNLKRVAGLDLSLEQNVNQATQVFRPFYEDKYLMKDMAFTKNFSSTYSKSMALKNSQDEKQRARYWDTGIKELQYRRDEFREATLDETLNMGNVSYTSYDNAMKKYLDLAKDLGLSVDVTVPDESGLYFVRQKNGELIQPSLQKLFISTYANDPSLQKMYSTQAYVNRKDYAYQNAEKFNNDKVAAEKDYLTEKYNWLKNYAAKRNAQNQEALEVTKKNVEVTEKAVQEGNVNPKQGSFVEQLNQALKIETAVANESEKVNNELKSQSSTAETTNGLQESLDLTDLELARLRVDAGVASYLAEQDIMAAADIYSHKDYVKDIEANPVGLENLRHTHAVQRIGLTHKNRMSEIEKQDKLTRDRDRVKHGISTGLLIYDDEGNPTLNPLYTQDNEEPGESGQAGQEVNVSKLNEELYRKKSHGLTKDFISKWFTDMNNLIATGGIQRHEVWNMIKLGSPEKGETGYKEFFELQRRFEREPAKVIAELTNSNMVLRMKKGMDKWASRHRGHAVEQEYSRNPYALNVEKYAALEDQYYAIEEANDKKIKAGIKKKLETAGYKFDQGDLEYLSKMYMNYMRGGDEVDAESFAKRTAAHFAKKTDASFRGASGYGWFDKGINGLNMDERAELNRALYQAKVKKGKALTPTETKNIQRNFIAGVYNVDPSSGQSDVSKLLSRAFHDISKGYMDVVTSPDSETGLQSLIPIQGNARGKAAVAANATSRFVNMGIPQSPGFKTMIQAYNDILRINWNQSRDKYKISIDGTTKGAGAWSPDLAKSMMRELINSAKEGAKNSPFKIKQSQVAMEDRNLAAFVVYPTREFLDKHVKSTVVDGERTTDKTAVEAAINQMMKKGVSFIAPKDEWSNDFVKGNDLTPTESLINARGSGGIKYKDPNGAGDYQISKATGVPGADYSINYTLRGMGPDGTPIEVPYTTYTQRRGNRIDDVELSIYHRILEVSNQNLQIFREFHKTNNQEALSNAQKHFGYTPTSSGFHY